MIDATAEFIKTRFGGEVVYGDTDSVFVRFPGKTLAQANALAHECEEVINQPAGPFRAPNYLEYEKIYEPFFLLAKKRYAGLKYVSLDKEPELSTSGMECVRRDNAPCLPLIQEAFLRSLIVGRDAKLAIREYHGHVIGLSCRYTTHKEQFTLTRKLSKANYKTPQIHDVLNRKIKERSPGEEYKVGDRVPYVVVRGKGPLYTRGECPRWLRQQLILLENVPAIDVEFYRDRIMGAMDRLLEPLLGFKALALFNERMINPNKQKMLTATGVTDKPFFPSPRAARRDDTDTAAAAAAAKSTSRKRKKERKEESERRQRQLTAFFTKT
jgi:DNA polymerase elongation subunit (family B)